MSTAFGLNLFLLSHLSMSWCCSARRCEPSCRELCPSPEARGPCCSAGVGTVRLQGGAELHWRRKGSTWPRVLAEGHRRVTGEGGEIGVQGCKPQVGSPETQGTRVIHRVSGKQPVALDKTCGIKTGSVSWWLLVCLGFVPAWIRGCAVPDLLCSCWTLQYTLAMVELPFHVFPWGH